MANFTEQRRIKSLRVAANPQDAAVIREAARKLRMTVSTYLLVAGLEKAAAERRQVVTGEGE